MCRCGFGLRKLFTAYFDYNAFLSSFAKLLSLPFSISFSVVVVLHLSESATIPYFDYCPFFGVLLKCFLSLLEFLFLLLSFYVCRSLADDVRLRF